MAIQNALASVAVKSLPDAVQWYESLFSRAPDSCPMPALAEWSFPQGGWLQVYELPQRAGQCSVTLAVDDIDEQGEQLLRMGVDIGQRSDSSSVRIIMVADPDGNHIAFAQPLDRRLAVQAPAASASL
ncbi:VOC family protein [Acidovorax sp.]|uniref:VOC family protein n=1 Tax=Acidovorax sp. TaxID=1872122 RepID=UPI00391ACAB6